MTQVSGGGKVSDARVSVDVPGVYKHNQTQCNHAGSGMREKRLACNL